MKQDVLLKGTNMYISPIAFGTVRAGLDWDGKDADRMLDAYVDYGGNLIDSARVYYDWVGTEIGRSERVLGDWLRRSKRRSKVILMTKGGHPNKDKMHVSRLGQNDMIYDIEHSLKTLGVEYIDIYFYHRDDPQRTVGELLERMEEFRKEGKICYYGCSNWRTERMREADIYAEKHGLTGFVANQNLFNIGSRYMKPFADETMVTVDDEAIEFYRCSNNTPMPYFGICSGFFHLLKSKGEQAVSDSCYYTKENLGVAAKVETICKKYNCSITQALMGFFFTQNFAVIPLVGSSDMEQLEDVMNSVEIPFLKEDYEI